MNRLKLEYEIRMHGYTIGSFCDAIHMSRNAFYRKSRGIAEFTITDIQTIIDVLSLDSPMGIFFDNKVS